MSVSFLTTDVEGEVTTGSLQYRARIVDDFCPFVSIGVEGGVGTGQLLFIEQLIIHEKSCFYVPLLFLPSLKTSTPRGEYLVTRPFCPKSDPLMYSVITACYQMSPNSGKHH